MNNLLPPYDLEIEKMVLGSIISLSSAMNDVRDIINEDCFYDKFNADVFNAIKALDDRGVKIDMMQVNNELLKKYQLSELGRFIDIVGCSTFNVYDLVRVLVDKSIRRKLFFLGQKINAMSLDENIEGEETINFANEEVKNILQNNEDSIFTLDDSIKNVVEIMNKNNSCTAELTGTPTGFRQLDNRGGGLQKSDLTIIGGDS